MTTTSDGARTTVSYKTTTLFDTGRNEECAYSRAADGQTRCMPTNLVKPGTVGFIYVDAQCNQDVVAVTKDSTAACGSTPSAPPRYFSFSRPSADPCASGRQSLMLVGAKLPVGTPIYGKSGGTCFAYQAAAASYDFYEIEPEIPASAFVSSTTVTTVTPDP